MSGLDLEKVPEQLFSSEPLPGVPFWEEVPPKMVDVSHNRIATFPEGLCGLLDLESIDVSHNELCALPPGMTQLTNMRSLDMSRNRISGLPPLPSASLARLTCGHNGLNSFPAGALPRLLYFAAEGNGFRSVPPGVLAAGGLLSLNLAGNRISAFPDLQTVPALEELDLSGNGLRGPVPGSLGRLGQLRVLSLQRNALTAIPPEVAGLVRLSELRLGSNRLRSVPAEIGTLSQLQTLDLSDNCLEALPAELSRLPLVLLDLRNNGLASLPPELGLMGSLRAMPVAGNTLRGLAPSVVAGPLRGLLAALRHRLPDQDKEDGESESRLANDRVSEAFRSMRGGGRASASLQLGGCGLESVPEEVWDPKTAGALASLCLANNQISELRADHIAAMTNLRTLDLHGNLIVSWPLPLEAGLLPHLASLDISRNAIAEIPDAAFTACSATLTTLVMSGVKAAARADASTLAACSKLKTLALDSCGLTEAPDKFLGLRSLEDLDLAANNIGKLLAHVSQLTALTRLSLAGNNLAALPPELGLLAPTLRVLDVDGNPLRTIRRPILEKGAQAVLECLRDRIR